MIYRAIVAALLIAGAPAYAADLPTTTTSTLRNILTTCQEQFAGLPALAERLGVKPGVGIDAGTVMLRMCDGTDYSMFSLIHAYPVNAQRS